MESTTAYMKFDGGKNECINSEKSDNLYIDSDILSPIINDATFTQKQRYQLAQVFEFAAKNLKNAPMRTYVSADNENYCFPEKRGKYYRHIEKRNIPKRVSENVFIITFLWQLICVMGLEAVDAITKHKINPEKPYYISGIIVLVIFQMANLILCLSVTVKLFKQYKHKNTSMKFLLHAYIATLFLFGGMYTFTAWIFPDSFSGLSNKKTSKFRALYLYSQLIFMSISTGTLCGAAQVTASHLTTQIMMSFQMLLSFLYFASIISEALNPSVIGTAKETMQKLKAFRLDQSASTLPKKKKKNRKRIDV